jgi:hypothetical protein
MAESPSTCHPHLERETLQVYVYLLRTLNSVGGRQERNRLSENGSDGSRDQALLRWPPRSSDISPCDLLLWGYVKDSVFYILYHGICLSCEEDFSLPFRKSVVTCSSGYVRKWIIELTSAVSQRADT